MFLLQLVLRSRLRIVAFISSLVTLLVLLLYLNSYASPQTLVPVSNQQSGSHHKVSVILCYPYVSYQYLKSVVKSVQSAFSNMNVQHEMFLVFPPSSSLNMVVRSLFPAHFHYELIPLSHTCTESIFDAMDKAHFSIIMALGANLTSYKEAIPKIIHPALTGKSDLVLADNVIESSNIWQNILTILLIPVTGTSHVLDTLAFAVQSSTWRHGCPHDGHGSIPVDLVSRCATKHSEIVPVSAKPGHGESLSLSQVFFLWWATHPFVCLLLVAAVLTVIFATLYRRLYTTRLVHSSTALILFFIYYL